MAGETLSSSIPGQTDATVAAKYDEENTGVNEQLSEVNPQPTLRLARRLQTKRTRCLAATHLLYLLFSFAQQDEPGLRVIGHMAAHGMAE